MKKLVITFLSLFLMFFLVSDVKASACDFEEKAKLNNEVGNVKINYEIIQEEDNNALPYEMNNDNAKHYIDKIKINIVNLTDNLFVEINNDYNNETKKYGFNSSKDGIISVVSPSINSIIHYKITIKASNKTGCENEVLRTFEYTQPRYNSLSGYSICSEIPDFYLCKPYVEFEDNVDIGEFFAKANKELEKIHQKTKEQEKQLNQKWYEKAINYVKNNRTTFIVVGGILLVTAGTTTVLIIRKRRRDII